LGSFEKRGGAQKSGEAICKTTGVKMSVQVGIGKVAAAYPALGLSRSSYYRSGQSSPETRRIGKEVLELSGKHLPTAIGVLRH
jgi:hypothetical protein